VSAKITEGTCIYQEAAAIEEKVQELQERVEALMIAVVRNVTAGSEEAKIVAAGSVLEGDLKNLFECVVLQAFEISGS